MSPMVFSSIAVKNARFFSLNSDIIGMSKMSFLVLARMRGCEITRKEIKMVCNGGELISLCCCLMKEVRRA